MNKLTKVILVVLGSIFVSLGILGIFLPLLPTTPFLLLGASCYIKGSERLYKWLLNNKLLGEYIRNYREKNGIPLKTKIFAIAMLWCTMLFTIVLVLSNIYFRLLLLVIAIGVTWHIATQKTLEQTTDEEEILEDDTAKDIDADLL